jgi:hypothetical protein
MAPDVLVKVRLLSERELAIQLAFEWANEGTLFRVDAEVVVKVMPLPKVHRTVRVVALQDLQVSPSLWILEFENSE